jgi:hypothetical protein
MTEQHVDLVLEITRTISAVEACGGEKAALELLKANYRKEHRVIPPKTLMLYDTFLHGVITAIDPERDKVAMAEEIAENIMHMFAGPVEAGVALFGRINQILEGGSNESKS